jgi:hypothetical protein
MLQVGNNLFSDTLGEFEEKTHFALWAFAKAPLFIGTDLANRSATDPAIKILSNEELISVNQEPKNKMAFKDETFKRTDKNIIDVYRSSVFKKDGAYIALLFVNWGYSNSTEVTYNFLDGKIANNKHDSCTVVDMYGDGTPVKVTAENPYKIADSIPGHGNAAIRVKCLPF